MRTISDNRLGQQIGSGICTNAYNDSENSNAVIIETNRIEKIRYWEYLGITWGKPDTRYTYDVYGQRVRYYRVVVTKLVEITDEDYAEIEAEATEMKRFVGYEVDDPTVIEELYFARHNFPIHKTIIEYLYSVRFKITWGFDCHNGNYLKCPVTGNIIAHDAFNFALKSDTRDRWTHF